MAAKKPEPPPATNLSREDIERLIDVIHTKGIEEFELEQGGMRVRIVSARHSSVSVAGYMPGYQAMPSIPAGSQPAHGAGANTIAGMAAAPSEPPDDDPRYKKVTSPMVGTFYRSPSPGSKSFVEVGDKVDQDTVLCIIEAMKLMNEIKAETRGTVKKILGDNAQPVEYGQVLFVIDPD